MNDLDCAIGELIESVQKVGVRDAPITMCQQIRLTGTDLVRDTGRLTHLYYKEYTLAQKVG